MNAIKRARHRAMVDAVVSALRKVAPAYYRDIAKVRYSVPSIEFAKGRDPVGGTESIGRQVDRLAWVLLKNPPEDLPLMAVRLRESLYLDDLLLGESLTAWLASGSV